MKKPKEKWVKVKAWVTHIPKTEAPNQMISISKTAGKAGWLPCYILVRKKDLEE